MKFPVRLAVLCALMISASPATARAKQGDVVVKELRELNGQPVRVRMSATFSDAGPGHYDSELSLEIGDGPPVPFAKLMTSTRPSLNKASSVKGASFTVAYGNENTEHRCARDRRYVEHWGIDAKTKAPHLVVKELVDNGVPSLTQADLAAIELGDRMRILNQCSGYSDEQMVAMCSAAA